MNQDILSRERRLYNPRYAGPRDMRLVDESAVFKALREPAYALWRERLYDADRHGESWMGLEAMASRLGMPLTKVRTLQAKLNHYFLCRHVSYGFEGNCHKGWVVEGVRVQPDGVLLPPEAWTAIVHSVREARRLSYTKHKALDAELKADLEQMARELDDAYLEGI